MTEQEVTPAGDSLRAIGLAMSEKAMQIADGTDQRIQEINKLANDNMSALHEALVDIGDSVRKACQTLKDATTDNFGLVATKLDDLAEYANQAKVALVEHHANIVNGVAALARLEERKLELPKITSGGAAKFELGVKRSASGNANPPPGDIMAEIEKLVEEAKP